MGEAAAREVEQTERARLIALVSGDATTMLRLHAPDYQLITPGGAAIGRDDYLDPIAQGSFRYRRFEPVSELRVRTWSDAAVVRYRAAIEVEWDGASDQGTFWHTDVYERRSDRWVAVWSHATRIPGPDR